MVEKKLPDVISGYDGLLQELTESIRQAQVRAGLAINRELTLLYWKIGREIVERQQAQGWGAKVIDRLAEDLRKNFPEMKGLSARNLKYMRAFADAYPDFEFVQAGPAQITWYHNCTLLDKLKDNGERAWFVAQTVEHGWTRDVMVHQIESGLYNRQGRAITNFQSTLPQAQSELAQQMLKDPYNFDFLTLSSKMLEKDLEEGLLEKLRDFLLELGSGFSFVGSQYHLEVGGQDYFIDLLFYHLRMRCFVVVDLKITDFVPEYAGKMGFYLSAVDEQLRHTDDRPSVGLILCKTKNRIIAEYALRSTQSPIGVSEYKLAQPLPEAIREELPTVEKLEKELGDRFVIGKSLLDGPDKLSGRLIEPADQSS
jgi:predicted nuclease of restriction endonuclease-like (RecB) superfamily